MDRRPNALREPAPRAPGQALPLLGWVAGSLGGDDTFGLLLAWFTFSEQNACVARSPKEKGYRMVLVFFAALGFFVGYRLEMTRAGYVTMALTAEGFSAAQITLLLLIRNREAMTLLPLVVGLVLVLFMLLGAFLRLALRGRSKAA
jgi:hypothetical protein